MGPDSPFEILEKLIKTDWSTRSSLLFGTLSNIFFVGTFSIFFKLINLNLPYQTYLIVLGIIEMLITLLYLYARWFRPFDSETVALGFAIKTNLETAPLYAELKKSFNLELEKLRLTELVKIRPLPSDLDFKSNKSAEKYLSDKGLRVLLWGDTSTGTSTGRKVSIFNIRVSYQHFPMADDRRPHLVATMQRGVVRGNWAISHDDSLAGVSIVSGNVLEISLYALAVCLSSLKDPILVERGVHVFEHLLQVLSGRDVDTNFPNLNEVREQIKHQLLELYMALSMFYFLEKHDLITAYKCSLLAVEISPNHYLANIQIARIAWEKGDHKSARAYTLRAAGVQPDQSLHRLNLAFFSLYDGKYSNALKHYSQIRGNVYVTNPIDVVDFILREYDKTNKPSLLFGAGWVDLKYGDAAYGRTLLRDFLEKTKDNSKEFEILRKKATKFLK